MAIARLQRLRALMPGDRAVTLLHREAVNFAGIPTDFDVVILNSVVQYFPGGEYLLRTLEQAVRSARPAEPCS